MKNAGWGLLGLWLIAAAAGAEPIKVIYKSGQLETGNIINATETAIFLEDSQSAVSEIPLAEIESMFAEDAEPITAEDLWKYRPRHALMAKMIVYPMGGLEADFVLAPVMSVAVRGTFHEQSANRFGTGGGFTLRFYPGHNAPRGWYFGPQVDYFGGYEWSLFTVRCEAGKKFYLHNGLVIGFAFAAGVPIPLSGFDGVGAIMLPAYFVSGSGAIGFSF